ncbi:MAG: hypothetical protein CV089_08400 [Nitrospira sp. WS110]|nr:hypothetical protein [Nitrospira sp. WS110]
MDWLLSQFGKQRTAAQRKYRAFVTDGIGQRSPWEQLQGQVLLGSDRFVARMAPRLQDKRGLNEIPRRQRFAARPAFTSCLVFALISTKLGATQSSAELTLNMAIPCPRSAMSWGYTIRRSAA